MRLRGKTAPIRAPASDFAGFKEYEQRHSTHLRLFTQSSFEASGADCNKDLCGEGLKRGTQGEGKTSRKRKKIFTNDSPEGRAVDAMFVGGRRE